MLMSITDYLHFPCLATRAAPLDERSNPTTDNGAVSGAAPS